MDRLRILEKARVCEQLAANRVQDELDGDGLNFFTLESWVDAKIALAEAVEGEGK